MSHFSVLVITEEKPTDELLTKTLQPWHEYECTGTEDQYVRFVPASESLDELKAEHARHKEEYPESTPENFEEHVEGWHGYELRDGVFGRMTNPDAKWDWWMVGGRWSGLLRAKPGADAEKGDPGLMGSQSDASGVDICQVKHLDLGGMLTQRQQEIRDGRRRVFEGVAQQHREKPIEGAALLDAENAWEQWDQLSVRAGQALETLRAAWGAAGEPGHFSTFIDERKEAGDEDANVLRLAGRLDYGNFMGISPGQTTEEAVAAAKPFCTFAVVFNGDWYQRGDMGWWGMVSGEDDDWESHFDQLLRDTPEDHWLAVVDCHI